jgi:hypothetical protein
VETVMPSAAMASVSTRSRGRFVGLALPVGEQDDVAGDGAGEGEVLLGRVEGGEDGRAAAGTDASQLVLDAHAVAGGLHPHDAFGLGVEDDHLQGVVGAEGAGRGERGRLRQREGRYPASSLSGR